MLKQMRNRPLISRLPDEIRFLRQWFDSPLKTGAVAPSSPMLARKMASYIDIEQPGLVVELGPGTGVVTNAVISRGVDPSRILAIEYCNHFVDLLRGRFSGATVIQGDAYNFDAIRQKHLDAPLAAVVSGLPLFTRPKDMRIRLIDMCLDALAPGAPFIQFSYALVPPVTEKEVNCDLKSSNWVIGNLPPARVWVYRRPMN